MIETNPLFGPQAQTIQQMLDLAIQHLNAGRLLEAENLFQHILQTDPDQPVALHLSGVIACQAGKNDIAVEYITKAIAAKPYYVEAHSNLGNAFQNLGRLDDAVTSYNKALAINGDYAPAHNNLGNALRALGQLEDAVASYRKAIAIRCDYAAAHNNLGNAFQDLGRAEDAVDIYRRALAIKPDYAEAHYNLGNALRRLLRYQDAVASYDKALAIKPDYVAAHVNIGLTYAAMGHLVETLASCRKALVIKPDHFEAHLTLGDTFQELGNSAKAVASYIEALAIQPGSAEAHNNLGAAYQDLGQFEEAIACQHKALAIKPDHLRAWTGLMISAKVQCFEQAQDDRQSISFEEGLSLAARATPNFAMLQYYLDCFRPHEADKSFKKAMVALPPRIDEEVAGEEPQSEGVNPLRLSSRLVALLHFGRSGTGLLHSLIDGHPEISTLPSIYLSGFFNSGAWNKIAADGLCGLPERFADEYAVLFDANSTKSIASGHGAELSDIGRKDGMTCVGEDRSESLSLDRDIFCSEALRLLKRLGKIDPGSFLQVVHAAFEKVLGATTQKHTIFYHIHDPDNFAKLNFLRFAPDARLVMMVREPIQSCESWVRSDFEKNDGIRMAARIVGMLFAIDQVAFRAHNSLGVRLEDLKKRPEETMQSLCSWLGVTETPSLYQMTAQGKKWWGDPTSPDYDGSKAMAPFDDASTKRRIGVVFSEMDQFVLRTLFYPFSVRFGYREPTPGQFKKDLNEVRLLLNDMLDFEKKMAERTYVDHGQFKRKAGYRFLRAGLADRLDVLDEFGSYPHMLAPLTIA
jgi:tetratricopeptide (TPR) repeat protein